MHILMKVETHNHPTAISPFPGAATGSGGEIRDEGATGRGAKPKAGADRLLRSRTCACPAPCGRGRRTTASPTRIASALDIMIDGPLGGAAFNNEFGRPNLAGYFRTFELRAGRGRRGCAATTSRSCSRAASATSAPGHVQQGIGQRRAPSSSCSADRRMLIGLGGGAASSHGAGAPSDEDLDFASVQRDNAEMQRRCQEVIDRCSALGDDNPIVVDPRRRRGRPVERAARAGARQRARRALRAARRCPNDEPGMSPLEIWCNEAQERYVLAICPRAARARSRRCARASAAPTPSSATPPTSDSSWLDDRALRRIARSTCRSRCCSASRRA